MKESYKKFKVDYFRVNQLNLQMPMAYSQMLGTFMLGAALMSRWFKRAGLESQQTEEEI